MLNGEGGLDTQRRDWGDKRGQIRLLLPQGTRVLEVPLQGGQFMEVQCVTGQISVSLYCL